MKRVLMFAPTLGGGGVCEVVKNLCSTLSKYYEIDLINTGILSEKNMLFFSNLNITITNIDRLQKVGYFKYVKNIKNVFRQNKYDVVHVHTDLIAWIVARIAKKNGVDTIVGHAHGQETFYIPRSIVKLVEKPLQFFNRKYCTDWVGCSYESIRHMFGKDGEILYNYVPYKKLLFLNDTEKN
ncbi:MAG: glycosyltransferase, partial [Clostridia bacterium]